MKKSILLLLVYWLTLAQKAEAQSHKFYFAPECNVYYELTGKQGFYNKSSKWSPSAMLLLTFKLTVSDRLSVYNNGGSDSEHMNII